MYQFGSSNPLCYTEARSSSFLRLPHKILNKSHKKELLWGLRLNLKPCLAALVAKAYRAVLADCNFILGTLITLT